jgi:hypothetical protein
VRDPEMDPSAVAGYTICGRSSVLHPFHHLRREGEGGRGGGK